MNILKCVCVCLSPRVIEEFLMFEVLELVRNLVAHGDAREGK